MTITRQSLLPVVFALCALVLGAVSAQAQFELTPFFGYRVGGELEDFDFDGVDLEDSESYGLIADFDVGGGFQVELLYSTQDTRLESVELFQPTAILDLDVEYFHGGVLYQWQPGGDVLPFITGSVGLTRLVPQQRGFETEDRFSFSVGGGAKLMLGEHVGLRFEGRGFTTFVDDDDDAFCDRRRCYRYDTTVLWQVEGRVGLVLRF